MVLPATLEEALAELSALMEVREAQQRAAEVARRVGRRYELQVVAHHAALTGQTVWHNEVIPEEELFQCGFIHDFNQHRLVRLALKADAEGREGPRYRDYGMDFLARDVGAEGGAEYHAGQAKYRSRGSIGANDLGTFLNVVNYRLRTPGHIYTTGPLEVNLREDVLNSRGMLVHHRLALAAEDAEAPPDATEVGYALRPYQRDAVDAICAPPPPAAEEGEEGGGTANRKALQLFCGGGKTLIAGHALRRRDDVLVVAIAPLKMSVDQLRTRIAPFLPRHEVLLVDSDDGGTTDLEEVRAAVARVRAGAGRLAIFSTFKSAEAVLARVDFGSGEAKGAFLLVDEVHNLVSNDALAAFTNRFDNSLLLSATLPEELFERMSVAKAFEFGMAEAIKGGFCCDYRVYLPLLEMRPDADAEKGRVVVGNVPEQLAGDDQTLAAKALFLVTGMLMRGSRRCIAYMGSKAECDAFILVLAKVVEANHGLTFWGGKIDCDVGREERCRLLCDFQAGSDAILRVLASVRILDEAIDVVRCDSQFVSHVGEDASDIRTVQRMCRGIRLDPANPAKVNALFMWSEEWGAALNALSLLRTMDVAFHTKVRVGSVEYEAGADRAVREVVGVQAGRLADYVAVKCLSWDDLFAWKAALFARFYAAHQRVPKQAEAFEGKKIGSMLDKFRSQRATMAPERRAALDAAMPGWDAVNEAKVAGMAAALTEEEKVALLTRFYAANKRVPKRTETFEGKKIGNMLTGFRSQRATMAPERRAALDAAMPGWDAVNEAKVAGMAAALTEEEKVALLTRFYAANKRVPKRTETFEGKKIGNMLTGFRSQRATMAPGRRAALDVAMPGWDAVNEALVAGIAAALTEEEKVALFARFYAAHHRVPKKEETFEGKKIGWMLNKFRNQRETMVPDRRAALDAAMPGWDAVNEAQVAGIAAALTEEEKVALFTRFYAAHQRVPKQAETFEGKNIGSMLNGFRGQRATMVPERRAALDAAMPGWDAVNEARVAAMAAAKQRRNHVIA